MEKLNEPAYILEKVGHDSRPAAVAAECVLQFR
jgi:hypothetical protein